MGQFKPAKFGAGLDFEAGSFGAARLAAPLFLIAILALSLSACGSGGNSTRLGERVIPLGQPVPKGGGIYHIGNPYEIAGIWYMPKEEPGYDRVGTASWYGELFHGRRTANGEIYDMDSLSAAHPTLPLPVYARVTNLNNGRSIVVRINDRGPYARDRIIDLSRRSAELLGFRGNGTATVRVKYLGRAPLNGDDSYERKYLASQNWVHFAAKGKTPRSWDDPVDVSSIGEKLPAENPENLVYPWKEGAPRSEMASTDPVLTSWRAPQATGSIARDAKPKLQEGKPNLQLNGPVIQAGSFKSKENADRARAALSAIAAVDVTPITVGEDVYFRVRVGPFTDLAEAKAALARVTEAGYQGAKMVMRN